NVCNCHGGTLPCRRPPNQWVLAGTWQLSALFLPDSPDRRLDTGPGRLVRGELPPQISSQLRDLAVGQAVLEGRHIAKVGRGRLGDAVQNELDQIVRHG